MPRLSSAVAGFLQSMRLAKRGVPNAVESRRELSARYMRELSELIDDRQLSSSDAERVVRDLFEPGEGSSAPRVRLAVWRSYVKERTGKVGLKLVGDLRDDPDDGIAD